MWHFKNRLKVKSDPKKEINKVAQKRIDEIKTFRKKNNQKKRSQNMLSFLRKMEL